MLRNHGQEEKYRHRVEGWNSRMDGIQAAVLEIKLRDLDHDNQRRNALARTYDRLLIGIHGVRRPALGRNRDHVYHLYAIRSTNRDDVMASLRAAGIGCSIHYPVPVHLQEAFAHLGYRRGDFRISERCSSELLSLPIYPTLALGDVEAVADALRAACGAPAEVDGLLFEYREAPAASPKRAAS